MQGDWLSQRVTLLEQRVERLEGLPAEVSALRQDMNAQFVSVRAEMAGEFAAARSEMDRRFDAVDQGLIFLQKQITDCRQTLEAKIEENRRHALVLHEQVMSSIATMGERPPSKPRKKR